MPKKNRETEILYHLPITRHWLEQFVLVSHMAGQSSYRRIRWSIKWLFDYEISLDAISNILSKHDATITAIHKSEDLKAIDCGANDEIFQCNKPILAGAHPYSLYCYLLSKETHRDHETWAINLYDLENKGYNPKFNIADNGSGLRKGHQHVFGNKPLRGDHYHILKTLSDLKRHLANKVKSSETAILNAEEQTQPTAYLKNEYTTNKKISEAMNTLIGWLQMDVLRIAGPDYEERSYLYDFIVDSISEIEQLYPERLGKAKRALIKQKHQLLSFAQSMDARVREIAVDLKVSPHLCWQLCEMLRYKPGRAKQVNQEQVLRRKLKGKYYETHQAISKLVATTIRTSSCIENYNSRIRPYFVLRKNVDQPFLNRLRFFLNHAPLLESSIPERRGKSPAQLLYNKEHPCWLEMLGYTMFKKAA